MYAWSPSNLSFFPTDRLDDYRHAGWDLTDIIDIDVNVYNEYTTNVPAGKRIGASADGLPCWVDIPPLSPEEQVSLADATKSALQREAEDAIKPLERAKSLGIATPQELSLLTEWEKYSVYLMRVDTSLAPNIDWPQKPQ